MLLKRLVLKKWLMGAMAAAVGAAGLVIPATAAAASVTVRPGDTLSSIAAHHGTTVRELIVLNHLSDPDHILIGSHLLLPSGAARSVTAAGSYVTVHPGDTLSALAARYGTTMADLASLNHITNYNHIEVGARLALPSVPGDDFVLADYSTPLASNTPTAASLSLLPAITPSRAGVLASLNYWSRVYGLPPGLLQGLTWWESGWQSKIVSSTGAIGIGQLEPSTVNFTRNVLIGIPRLNPRVPDDNVRMAAAYLRYLLRRTGGSSKLAVAAYYQGLTSVLRSGPSRDTMHYVTGILNYARIFASS